MDERRLEVLHKRPLIFYIDNFLSEEECRTIINYSKDKMELDQQRKFHL